MKEQSLLNLPAPEPSPHEAQSMADLITPFQHKEILDLCRQLKTKPVVEIWAMFRCGVNFWRLHRHSARALAIRLRSILELEP